MVKDGREDFSRAVSLHRQGRLEEAIGIYRRLLKARKGAFEVESLLVFALLEAGRSKEALAAARRAREAQPTNPHAQMLFGAALEAEGKPDKALAAFETAARLGPDLSEAHYRAGNVLLAMGRPAEAVERFDQALAHDPRFVEALANRAAARAKAGRAAEALADHESLLAMQPWEAKHWISKAGTLLDLGRFKEAAAAASEAARLAPKLADAHFLKGHGLAGQADLEGARASYGTAASLQPAHPLFAATHARIGRHLGDHAGAHAILRKALAAIPEAPALLQERAELRRETGDLSGALADVEKALALEPASPIALTTKARLMADLGQGDAVRPLVDTALAADPTFPMARYLQGTDDLAHGRWKTGWAAYESRASFLPPPYRPLPFARWEGGRRPEELIVVGEQGIGDLIQFGRLLRVLADRGIPARLLTKAAHVPLLSRIDARVPVISDLSHVDTSRPGLRWAPLASLPALIAPDPALWPRAPYLSPDPERVSRWRSVRGRGLMVGINWQGNPSPAVDVGRSVPLEAFAPLAALPGVELVSLQYGSGSEQVARASFADAIQLLPEDRDKDGTFVDLSAVLQHLDLVVTTDTSVAHLAGARGRRTFLALRRVPDWRWGISGTGIDLYPSLTLFRQTRAGVWDDVFAAIAGAVEGVLAEAGSRDYA